MELAKEPAGRKRTRQKGTWGQGRAGEDNRDNEVLQRSSLPCMLIKMLATKATNKEEPCSVWSRFWGLHFHKNKGSLEVEDSGNTEEARVAPSYCP
jgi:hypothetical protein